ncbi:MAG: transposase, partial [Kiritimatiellia bacterium]|nr:transposase [Kiritimatiellia bacterium]
GTIAVVRRLIVMLRRHFGSTRLYLRADSSFAVPEFFAFLESEEMRYAIAMGSNSVLEGLSQSAMEKTREQAADTQTTATIYGSDVYKSGGWKKERRVAYKAQVLVHPDKDDHRDNDRYVIHNLDYRYGPEGAFGFYYGHSDMENRIKELKNDMAMDRTSCSRFAANQFRLIMTLAAYVLMQSVAERTADLGLLKAQMATLRDRLLKIAVRVRSSARRITLEFTTHHPWADAWLEAAQALGAIPT